MVPIGIINKYIRLKINVTQNSHFSLSFELITAIKVINKPQDPLNPQKYKYARAVLISEAISLSVDRVPSSIPKKSKATCQKNNVIPMRTTLFIAKPRYTKKRATFILKHLTA